MGKEKTVVGLVERIVVIGGKRIKTYAKFDTGARFTSIDSKLAEKAQLGDSVGKVRIKSALGRGHERNVVNAILKIKGKSHEMKVNVSDRSHSKFKVLIGRDMIHGNFVIDIEKSHHGFRERDLREDTAEEEEMVLESGSELEDDEKTMFRES